MTLSSNASDALLNATMPEYLQARLRELEGRKSLREIAEEIGYRRAKIIVMFARGEAHVPINRTLQLARALEAPLLPFFRLVLAQFGRGWAELGDAIYESKASPDTGQRAFDIPLQRLSSPSPTIVEMRFEVPAEFRRQFRLEGERRGLKDSQLLMLAFQTYSSYWA